MDQQLIDDRSERFEARTVRDHPQPRGTGTTRNTPASVGCVRGYKEQVFLFNPRIRCERTNNVPKRGARNRASAIRPCPVLACPGPIAPRCRKKLLDTAAAHGLSRARTPSAATSRETPGTAKPRHQLYANARTP